MNSPAIEEETGSLLVSRTGWQALLHRIGVTDEAPAGVGPELESLRAAGVLEDEAIDVRLVEPLRAIVTPLSRLRIVRGPGEAHACLGADLAALAVPEREGLLRVTGVLPELLPDALAALLELSPRPLLQSASLSVSAGVLARAIASAGEGRRGRESLLGRVPDAERVLAGSLDHWLVEAIPTEVTEVPAELRVEVLDTEMGLWRLEPDRDQVRLEPTSPTLVWRRLVRLVQAAASGRT